MQEGGLDTATDTSNEENSSPEEVANKDLFEEKPGVDHFKNEETDPKKSNAMSKPFPILVIVVHINCQTPPAIIILSLYFLVYELGNLISYIVLKFVK